MKLRICLAVWLLALCLPMRAAEPERVLLSENFSTAEIVTATGIVLVGTASFLFQEPLIEQLDKDPLIGVPPALDVRLSDLLYRGPGAGRYMKGVPDVVGQIVAPGISLIYYGGGAAALGVLGRGWMGDLNADHRFFAFMEAYGVSLTATQLVKLSIGRTRPDTWFMRGPRYEEYLATGEADLEVNLSFFSGHTSSSFSLASFVTRDLTDWLVHDPLADASPVAKILLGRLLPGAVLYGSAGLIGFSRIVDQRHFASDVLVGALVGTLSGNLFYSLHFDAAGNPRRRSKSALSARVVPFPGGLALEGRFR